MKVKILVATQKPVSIPHDDIYQLIQVGSKGRPSIFDGILRDDTGDNISDKNGSFCELTAQYWAWKNLDLDYYGFCHYRRYLSFSNKENYTLDNGNILSDRLDEDAEKEFNLNGNVIQENLKKADVVISKKLDVRYLSKGYKNVYDHYANAPHLNKQDMDLMMDIIKEKEPAYEKCANDVLHGRVSYFCNMYVMQKKLFFSYCAWLFPLLFEFERRNPMEHYDVQAYRTPGHLAERLVTVFLQHQKEMGPSLNLIEKQQILFQDVTSSMEVKPAFLENNIPIVMSIGDEYVPQCSVVLASILQNSSEQNNYDLLVLDTDISESHKEILRGMIQGKTNFSLRFVPIASYLRNWKIQQVAHVPARSYYRLWIPTVLKDYKKVLYIDCDLVVCHDLAELYRTDIGDNYLAGVKDADFQGQINRKNFDTMEYAKKTLHLDDPYSYVQAGVLLFNNDALNRDHKEKEFIEKAEKGYRYMDQDVLNSTCQGKIRFLDQRWNVINDCNHERIKEVISYAPHQLYEEYMGARDNPFIIHYAGKIKPWNFIDDDFCEVFWKYARVSSFFVDLISSLKVSKTGKAKEPQQSVSDRLLPKGTKRREIAVSLVRKISSIK